MMTMIDEATHERLEGMGPSMHQRAIALFYLTAAFMQENGMTHIRGPRIRRLVPWPTPKVIHALLEVGLFEADGNNGIRIPAMEDVNAAL